MPRFIHDLQEWPSFRYDTASLLAPLSEAQRRKGLLIGRLEGIGVNDQQQAKIISLTSEIMNSSEIEGERLDFEQVRSSIARRLGFEFGGVQSADRRIEGVVEMAVDATERWQDPLTKDRLLNWQAGLFPGGRGPHGSIQIGSWRSDEKGPMQVVSGAIGRERVHFAAPAAERLESEMQRFLNWFETNNSIDWVIKAGISHLWFETIHPFDDGNGRVGRAVLDLALARADRVPFRCYSVSTQLRHERNDYYDQLEASQSGSMDCTAWLLWYLGCLSRALGTASTLIAGVIERSRFWSHHSNKPMNERQQEMLARMLFAWEGKMSVQKWSKMKKVSIKTAQRDITDLYEMGILLRESGGRSTTYVLAPLQKSKDEHF